MRDWLNFLRTDTIPRRARGTYIHEMRFYLLWILLFGAVEPNLNSIVAKKTFGASDQLTTLIWSIPIIANILNVLWGVLLRGRRRIPVMVGCCAGIAALVASMAALPPDSPWAGWVFAAQLAAVFTLWSAVITLRTSLWQVNYPATHRAQITGRMQMLRILGRMSVPLVLGALYEQDPLLYRYVYPAAAICGLLSLISLSRIKVRKEDREIAGLRQHVEQRLGGQRHPLVRFWRGLHESFEILWQDPLYRNYMLAQFLLGSANFFTEPVLILILTTDLQFGYFWSVVTMTLIRSVTMLLTTPAWSALFDRVTIFEFRVYNSAFWVASYGCVAAAMILLTVLGPQEPTLVVGLIVLARVLNGCGGGGGMLAWPLGHLAFAREHNANLYLGIHVALTGVRGLLMPQVAGLLRLLYGNPVLVGGLLLSAASHLLYRRLMHQQRAQRSTEAEDRTDSAE